MIWTILLIVSIIGVAVGFFALGYLIGRDKGVREGIEYYRQIGE